MSVRAYFCVFVHGCVHAYVRECALLVPAVRRPRSFSYVSFHNYK